MKISLVFPDISDVFNSYFMESYLEPLGLLYLSAVLKRAGHEIDLVDQRLEKLTMAGMEKRIADFGPLLVGISVTYANFAKSEKLAALVKKNLKVPVIVGGCYPTAHPEMVLLPHIDLVALGEGEETILEVAGRLEKSGDLYGIAGTAWEREGLVVFGPIRPRIEFPDMIPFPDRSWSDPAGNQMRIAHPAGPGTRALSVMSSRGCGNRCGFCFSHFMWGGKWIGRSPRNVMEEILLLKKNQRVNTILFRDEELNFDRDRAIRLYRLMKKEAPGMGFVGESSPRYMDLELADIMVEAGLKALFMGFESGAPEIIRRLGKRYDIEKALEITRYLQKKGVFVSGSFMLGLPWESRRTINKTIRYACKLNLDLVAVGYHRPQKGTPFYDLSKKWDLFTNRDYDERTHNPNQSPVRSLYLSGKQLEKAVGRLMMTVYGRPDFWFRLCWRIMRDPKRFGSYALFLLVAGATFLRFRKKTGTGHMKDSAD